MANTQSEFELRKEAIQRYISQGQKPGEIITALGKTKGWWDYVLKRYKKFGIKGLKTSPRGYPRHKRRKFRYDIRKLIKEIRERLEKENEEYFSMVLRARPNVL